MADLMKKTKYINIVIRKKDLDISERDSLILRWCKDNCINYAYIYHDKDESVEFHVPLPTHLHLVAVLKDAVRLSTCLHSICEALSINTLGVEIDKCNSVEGSIQYLIHKNDSNKYQYDISKVVSNYGDELNTIMDATCDNLTPQRLRALVKNCTTNYELIAALGLDNYVKYRKVISDIRDDFRIWNY